MPKKRNVSKKFETRVAHKVKNQIKANVGGGLVVDYQEKTTDCAVG